MNKPVLHVITTSLALTCPSIPSGAVSADFHINLEAPVEFRNVDVTLNTSDGIELDVSYELARVGRVLVSLRGDDEGNGFGLVMVEDNVVVEIETVGGVIVSNWGDLTRLRTTQMHDAAAGVVQIWCEEAVVRALEAAPRDGKCKLAGKIAGASTGTLVGAGCYLFVKKKWCTGLGTAVYTEVSGWISAKCDKAQNG